MYMESIKQVVRSIMRVIAQALHSVSGGRISANLVTWTGLLAHLPIVWLLANGYHGYAAAGIIFFGLFDTLDGELARLQKTQSNYGMFLDSVTDRAKEILIYVGIGFYLSYDSVLVSRVFDSLYFSQIMPWVVLALGLSLLTTYLNAWGEVALTRAKKSTSTANQVLRGGFAPYEIRIALLALGLLTGEIMLVCVIISVLAGTTVADRFWRVAKRIK
jgi:CDP-diacylglycerol--glycerol-3-phosphate 3-phosphatidyltransferase